MNLENPAIAIKNKLESLEEAINKCTENQKVFSEDFSKFLESYYSWVSVEPDSKSNYLRDRFWDDIQDKVGKLSCSLEFVTDKNRFRAYHGNLNSLKSYISNIKGKFTNSESKSSVINSIIQAVQHAINLEMLGNEAYIDAKAYREEINKFMDHIQEIKNQILSSSLEQDLKEILLKKLDEIEKILRKDYLNKEEIFRKYQDFASDVALQSYNPNHSKEAKEFLVDIMPKIYKIACFTYKAVPFASDLVNLVKQIGT